MIHKTAIIDGKAQIGTGVQIGANAFIGENVVLHNNVKIMPNAYLENCEIGEETVIYPFASIGTTPQDLGYKNEPTKSIIGKNCLIREYVTVNRASGEGCTTRVGDRCLLMAYAHVAHNGVLEDEVIMANVATIGGHVYVGKGAFLGGQSVYHQNIRIGEMSIISGASAARLDILPYTKSEGIPAFPKGINAIGLKRRGVSSEERLQINKALKTLVSHEYNTTQAIEEIEKSVIMNDYVRKIIEFIQSSKRGVSIKTKDFFQERDRENG